MELIRMVGYSLEYITYIIKSVTYLSGIYIVMYTLTDVLTNDKTLHENIESYKMDIQISIFDMAVKMKMIYEDYFSEKLNMMLEKLDNYGIIKNKKQEYGKDYKEYKIGGISYIIHETIYNSNKKIEQYDTLPIMSIEVETDNQKYDIYDIIKPYMVLNNIITCNMLINLIENQENIKINYREVNNKREYDIKITALDKDFNILKIVNIVENEQIQFMETKIELLKNAMYVKTNK